MTGSHIELFAGVGMAGIAAEAFGFKTIATAEIDPFCRSVLRQRHPDALHYSDVRDVHHGALLAKAIQRPLLMSGGFPCQDVSAIGAGAGLDGARSGLWSEFKRVIGEFKPEYVLIENSPMLRARGLDRVLADLASLGYDCRWDCIPAASVGAPHLRDRIFIVAWRYEPGMCEDVADEPGNIGAVSYKGNIYMNDGTDTPLTRFPRAGRMTNGVVFKQEPQATHKQAKQAILAHKVPCPATPNGYWPTPCASLPQEGEGPETWLARREVLKAKHVNGNGAGMPLSIAVKLFPTPRKAPNEWRTTRNAPSHGNGHGATLAGTLNDLERSEGRTPAPSSDSAGNVSPEWVEWMMGLPMGWTDPSVGNERLVPHLGWDSEHGIPRTAGAVPNRKNRLMALGNGLVPQAAAVALNMIPKGAIRAA